MTRRLERLLLRYPLRRSLPVMLVATGLLLVASVWLVEARSGAADVERRATADLRRHLTDLQGRVEFLLREGAHDQLREEIAALGADVDLELAAVVGADGIVMAANRQADVGRPFGSVVDADGRAELPHRLRAVEATLASAHSRVQALGEHDLLGVVPLALFVRPRDGGESPEFLYVERDLSRERARVAAVARGDVFAFAAFMLLLAPGLGLFLHFALGRRLRRLGHAADSLTRGAHRDVRLEGNDEVAHLGAAFDRMVAELAAQQRELRASEEQLRALVEHLPVVVYRSEVDRADGEPGRWLYVSPHIEQLTGFTVDEWCAHPSPWRDRIHREDLGQVIANEEEGFEEEHGVDEYRLVHRDGSIRHVRDEAFVVTAADGGRHWQGILVDVTAERELEERLRHSAKLEAVGQLAGGIAHDFNNLLTAVSGYGMLALQQAEGLPELEEDLREILKASRRASDLTSQLLTFSRRQPVTSGTTVDLNVAVTDLHPMLRRLIDPSIELAVLCDPDPCFVGADATQVDQVLLNLAVNARDAMPDGGTLTISCRRRGDEVVLTVTDTGIGMDDDVRARIFEPFFTTKGIGRGTGLGLATVHGAVTAFGGRVDVSSAPGAGTTFEVVLPAAEPPVGGVAPAVQAPIPRRTGRILLVEDEPAVRGYARRILVDRGHSVVEARYASEALELLDQGVEVDLLLSDVVMPGASGHELADRVSERLPGLPIILMSGYDDRPADLRGEGRRRLPKPFTLEQLAHAIDEALDGPPAGAPAPSSS